MKNIELYYSDKYAASDYEHISSNIFYKDGYYYTSLSFVQEESHGEGKSSNDISLSYINKSNL